MLKEVILSALIATPLGLALVIGLIYFFVLVVREAHMWRMARIEAFDEEDLLEIEGEEVVYGYY